MSTENEDMLEEIKKLRRLPEFPTMIVEYIIDKFDWLIEKLEQSWVISKAFQDAAHDLAEQRDKAKAEVESLRKQLEEVEKK